MGSITYVSAWPGLTTSYWVYWVLLGFYHSLQRPAIVTLMYVTSSEWLKYFLKGFCAVVLGPIGFYWDERVVIPEIILFNACYVIFHRFGRSFSIALLFFNQVSVDSENHGNKKKSLSGIKKLDSIKGERERETFFSIRKSRKTTEKCVGQRRRKRKRMEEEVNQ